MQRSMVPDDQTFGDWLRSELARRGMTMTALANEMGVSQAAVSRWVAGLRSPDVESSERMALVLGVPPEVVVEKAGHRRFHADRLAVLRGELAGIEAEFRELRRCVVELETRKEEIEAEIA